MKKLFNSDSDRELWIRLNAQNQIEFEKSLTYFDKETSTYKPTKQALNPRSMNDALIIARSQCEFDEENGKLRYTLEDLLLLDDESLNKIRMENHKTYINKLK